MSKNTYGHFDAAAREYVVTRPDTPRSWTNYLGDTRYGAIITNNAGGYSFYRSAAQGRFLRLRFNAVPMDQPGRYFYLRDSESGEFWSSSWQPVGRPHGDFQSVCRHGTGYTIIESACSGIASESLYFVPIGRLYEVWRLRVRNDSDRARKLSVFSYCEFANDWNTTQDLVNLQYSQYIVEARAEPGRIGITINKNLTPHSRNLLADGQSKSAWKIMLGGAASRWDTDRDIFLGPYGGYSAPDRVRGGACANSLAFGDNACGTFQADIALDPGETRDITVLVGVGALEDEGAAAEAECDVPGVVDLELEKLRTHWHSRFLVQQVETPDANFDHMANVWNPYNSLITFAWSRAASLVYNGERDGLGFRDSVQDCLGVVSMIPDATRERLELMLTGQVACGGAMPVVQPFAHRPGHEKPPAHEGYRSDDCLWFFNAIPAYVAETGDIDFYNKVLPYADAGEATVFGHLRRALEFNLERRGAHGLPCGLEADWNDCLRLGYHGESLFVAFQVRLGLGVYADVARRLGRPDDAAWALAERDGLDRAISGHCWDGEWFIWAIGEDGTVYGTKESPEGSIYLNTQIWAVISGAGDERQRTTCMEAVHERLATEFGLRLAAPPFSKMPIDVMRAVLFNAGTKENGGIFCHPQSWAVMAECLLGNGDRAYAYHRAHMPAAQNDRIDVRGIEPYVHCQSAHGPESPKFGASRIPWLSGTAAWTHYVSTHYILGIRPEIEGLRIDPCIPKAWPGFNVRRVFRGATYEIEVRNPEGVHCGVTSLVVDGLTCDGNVVPPAAAGSTVRVLATLGSPTPKKSINRSSSL
jgi:cellobiose phosphorylase